MIPLHSLEALIVVGLFALAFTSIGILVLHRLRIESRDGESLLFAFAIGAIVSEVALLAGALLSNVRLGVVAAIVTLAVMSLFGVAEVLQSLTAIGRKLLKLPFAERILAGCVLAVLCAEGFAAMAPLTGSDALHYHFTIPAQYLREGFHANWFLPHSFFLGQGHQLILAGLALGSEKLALGLIFLGGAAASLAIVRLTRVWAEGSWPWAAALVFLLTPVVF